METCPPIITIVTPSYNQGSFLDETLRSVVGQEGNFFIDYIVKDGGSVDNSTSIIERLNTDLTSGRDSLMLEGKRFFLPRGSDELIKCRGIAFSWISEPDGGQSNAINSGFSEGVGELLAWLNSDDYYSNNRVLQTVLDCFHRLPDDPGVIFGKGYIVDTVGKILRDYHSNTIVQDFDRKALSIQCTLLQPSAFITRRAYSVSGGVDPRLHYAMDWDLWIRLSKEFNFHFIPEYLSCWRQHDSIKSGEQSYKLIREKLFVIDKNNGILRSLYFKLLHLISYPGYLEYGRALMRADGLKPNPVIDLLLRSFRRLYLNSCLPAPFNARSKGWKRMAVIGPVLPHKTGVADYSAKVVRGILEQNPEMLVDLYTTADVLQQVHENPRTRIMDHILFDYYREAYDHVLFVMGNNRGFHSFVVPHIKKYSRKGAVEFHDVACRMVYESSFNEIESAIQQFGGSPGLKSVVRLLRAYGRAIRVDGAFYYDFLRHLGSLLSLRRFSFGDARHFWGRWMPVRRAGRAIVRAEALIDEYGLPRSRCTVIPLPTELRTVPANFKRELVQNKYRIPAGHSIVLSLGFIHQTKYNDLIAKAIQDIRAKNIPVVYVCGGEDWWQGESFSDFIDREGLSDFVRVTGWLGEEDMEALIAASDVGVNLRTNLAGEHSGSIGYFLGYCKPLIIARDAVYESFPENVLVRIEKDGLRKEALSEALIGLLTDESRRNSISLAQRSFVDQNLDVSVLGRSYLEASRVRWNKGPE